MDKKAIQKTIKIFAQRAKRELQADKVVLFGSHARGQANLYSDIDLIVISEMFSKVPEEKRLDILYPLTRGLSPDIHPFGYTEKEFSRTKQSSTLSEAKKEGVIVS